MSQSRISTIKIVAEGQTEQLFVHNTLQSHFSNIMPEIWVSAVIIKTGKKHDTVYRGGVTNYTKIRRETERHLKQSLKKGQIVTTMFDMYGLPTDFPGYAESKEMSPRDRVKFLEKSFKEDLSESFDDPRHFVPYIQLHEFEALVLVNPDELVWFRERWEKGIQELKDEIRGIDPELIDDDIESAPSKRIEKYLTGFRNVKSKVSPIAAERIGLHALRTKCPHFDEWLKALEILLKR